MAKPQKSDGSGVVTIAPSEVDKLIRQATGLPSNFFIATQKVKVLADGSLEAKYNFSNDSQPPPPTALAEDEVPTP